ncbi:unnamed protein product [Brassica oleracea var. botrytis]
MHSSFQNQLSHLSHYFWFLRRYHLSSLSISLCSPSEPLFQNKLSDFYSLVSPESLGFIQLAPSLLI